MHGMYTLPVQLTPTTGGDAPLFSNTHVFPHPECSQNRKPRAKGVKATAGSKCM